MGGGIKKLPLIVITGPTASGKTALSLELAERIKIEIISADSRQIYRHLNIGTAKPTKDELAAAPHHYIDILDPNEYYSSGIFGEDAYQKVQDIYYRNKIPIAVGGSGLYIQALCEGFFEESTNSDNPQIREILEKDVIDKGIDFLYDA